MSYKQRTDLSTLDPVASLQALPLAWYHRAFAHDAVSSLCLHHSSSFLRVIPDCQDFSVPFTVGS